MLREPCPFSWWITITQLTLKTMQDLAVIVVGHLVGAQMIVKISSSSLSHHIHYQFLAFFVLGGKTRVSKSLLVLVLLLIG